MNVAIITSVSDAIRDVATLTTPNKLEYCLRHGYSLLLDNQPYDDAIRNTHLHIHQLDRFGLIWLLDADTVITDMRQRIEDLPCLGPHWTSCEEGIVDWNRINCGSNVIRNTPEARSLLQYLHAHEADWKPLSCGWQTMLGGSRFNPPDLVTVAPLRAFNSCVWNRPGNQRDEIGGNWQPGDFVYHACGVYPTEERLRWLTAALEQVTR